MSSTQKKLILIAILVTAVISPSDSFALTPNGSLFQESGGMSGGSVPAQAPDQYQEPHSRQAQNQVPEKLKFVFQGHSYGMQSMGGHFVSDVQTLLGDVETINREAWNDFFGKAKEEFDLYSSPGTPMALASAPAGALAIGALDNAAAVGKQNVEFGIRFLFEGLGNQQGGDCNGTVRGMLRGDCRWGTPPNIESAIFSNIIGGDVNLNQLGGDYEVWGVSPARSTLINLIFNQGLFQ